MSPRTLPALLAVLLSSTALIHTAGAAARRASADLPPLPTLDAAIASPGSYSAGLPISECSFSATGAACKSPVTAASRPEPSTPAPAPAPAASAPAPSVSAGLRNPPPASAGMMRTSAMSASLLPLAALPRRGEPLRDGPQRFEDGRYADTHDEEPAAAPAPRIRQPVAHLTRRPPAMTPADTVAVENTLTLEAGQGRVIRLGGNTTSVFAADPKVAEVRPASPNSLFVFGVAPGRTTVAALDASGQPVGQYDVTVTPSSYAAGAARGAIARALPGHDVRLDTFANGLAVNGSMGSPADAARAMQIARGFLSPGQTAANRMDVRSSVQVNLRVRIVEMSRNLTRDLGVNWSAMAQIGKYTTFGAATATVLSGLTQVANTVSLANKGINAVIDALAADQMIHMLAEPNLTAVSGETASFLVGGEFPIPVAQQNNQTTIEFKQYGVSLAFVPTVLSDGHISLKVRPEVSQLTTQGAVQLSAGNSTIQVPAISVRRAETTVELGSGQSFAIAGLLQDSASIADSSVPFLGDLPIIGALFRSDAFQRNETELVIIVTPYVVRPVSDPARLALPNDNKPVPNDFERLLLLRQVGRPPSGGAPAQPAGARAVMNAGFVVQ